MLPEFRQRFNSNFTPAKYREFLDGLERACGAPVPFRNCETPCFLPRDLLEKMTAAGKQMIGQLVDSPEYLRRAESAIPAPFKVPGGGDHPLFVQVDFGLVRDDAGRVQPRLVEIQGFPSLYAYQLTVAEEYRRAYALDADLDFLAGGLDVDEYCSLLRRAVLGRHAPENVVLLEIDPFEQKTLPDFLLTAKLTGVRILNAYDVVAQGLKLFYSANGTLVPIRRIYNRVIFDELARRDRPLPFDPRDDLNLEWADHPKWFYCISKFSLPFLRHEFVPATRFLSDEAGLPDHPERFVLKPLYSFAGLGVVIGPTREQLESIPAGQRSEYILQERLEFAPVIDTPCGPTKVEVRIMFLWVDGLRAGAVLLRMGRGAMMNVSFNRNVEWVGSSAAFFPAA
jgi:hypothetical protein